MKYGLPINVINNYKGRITESLVRYYISENLIPRLKEEKGWTDVFFGKLESPLNRIEKELLQGNTQAVKEMEEWNRGYYLDRPKDIISEINKAFLCKKIFPNQQLLDNCLKLLMVLGVSTDGMIFKTKRINKKISKQKALSTINENYNRVNLETNIPVNYVDKDDLPEKIPLVDGDIEIIEVKSGNARIPLHQIEDYQKAIENGFFLRYFHVNIISFKDNMFELKEKLITNPREVTSYPLKTKI